MPICGKDLVQLHRYGLVGLPGQVGARVLVFLRDRLSPLFTFWGAMFKFPVIGNLGNSIMFPGHMTQDADVVELGQFFEI